jgi:hypothetical protein
LISPVPRKTTSNSQRRAPTADVDAAERALMRASQDPANIPGIYNYCDRWCERCGFTARCLSFKMGEARDQQKTEASSARRSDDENAAFWDDIAVNFALTLRLVKREAKKRGIDLDSPAALDEASRDERRRERRAAREGSALHSAAIAYLDATRLLLDRLAPELRDAEEALNLQLRLGTGAPNSTAAEIRDALDVVQWYLFFIDAKLQRAVSSRLDPRRGDEDRFPSDADGSAKIALVAIDRSLAAWARLRPHLTGEADAIIDLLVQLERLRQSVEREFPNARSFKRPGFDEREQLHGTHDSL